MRVFNLFMLFVACGVLSASSTKREVAPGVYVLSIGEKSRFTPYELFAGSFDSLQMSRFGKNTLPFPIEEIVVRKNGRGCSVAIPLTDDEQLYGFGMQIGSFQQRGLKKRPLVNDYPLNNLGYTHAPQPFYISTVGYGILINTSRYTTFHCGSNKPKGKSEVSDASRRQGTTDVKELYKSDNAGGYVFVDIPNAEGVEVFVIEGNGIREVVQRYNLLSGGGCLPPLWGLGLKYRVVGDCLMAAPLYTDGNTRKVYFPSGTTWYNFNTNEIYEGGREYVIENKFSELPLYAKSGSILPLAEPVLCITPETTFRITCNVYGKNPASFALFEDDGESYDYRQGRFNVVTLSVGNKDKGSVKRTGSFKGKRFLIDKWEFI